MYRFTSRSMSRLGNRLRRGNSCMVVFLLLTTLIIFVFFSLHQNELTINFRQSDLLDCTNCTELAVIEEEISPTVEDYMIQRRSQIAQACSNLPKEAKLDNLGHVMLSRRHKFLYCPVEKSASTFWRRFVYQLILTDPMQSPFNVSVQTVYSGMFPGSKTKLTESGAQLGQILDTFTKMLFIREPYSRLLSAYVDKLLAPNPILWRMWGRPALDLCSGATRKPWCKNRYHGNSQSSSRHNGSSNSTGEKKEIPAHCAQDVTFAEFIKLATSSLALSNPHVMPIYRLCAPCHANYTIIGHMETFNRDVKRLLPRINVTEAQVQLEKMDNQVAYDAIEDSVHDAMSDAWLKQSLKCISKMEVIQRIWRKLQIRGFVSWRLTPALFNIDPHSPGVMDGRSLIRTLVEANRLSTDLRELKLQKKQALKEAFSSLHPEQFTEMSDTFGPDFKLFGFDETPKAFEDFRKDGFVNTGAFDLSKDWNMKKVFEVP